MFMLFFCPADLLQRACLRRLPSSLLLRARAFLAATSSAIALFFAESTPLCLVDERMLMACASDISLKRSHSDTLSGELKLM